MNEKQDLFLKEFLWKMFNMRPQRQIFVSEDAKVFIRGYKLWVLWVDLIEGRSAGAFFLCENKIPFVYY